MPHRTASIVAALLLLLPACAVDGERELLFAARPLSAADEAAHGLLFFVRASQLEACLADEPTSCLPLEGDETDAALDDETLDLMLDASMELLDDDAARSDNGDDPLPRATLLTAAGLVCVTLAAIVVTSALSKRRPNFDRLRSAARGVVAAIEREALTTAQRARCLIEARNPVLRANDPVVRGPVVGSSTSGAVPGLTQAHLDAAWRQLKDTASLNSGRPGSVLQSLGSFRGRSRIQADGSLTIPTYVDGVICDVAVPPEAIDAVERFARLRYAAGLVASREMDWAHFDHRRLRSALAEARTIVSDELAALIETVRRIPRS